MDTINAALRIVAYLYIAVLVAIVGAVNFSTTAEAFSLQNSDQCTIFDREMNPAPAGWGDPVDMVNDRPGWLITSDCSGSHNYGMHIIFGEAPSDYYTYNKAYVYDYDNGWQQFSLTPFDGVEAGDWVAGLAEGYVPWTLLDNAPGQGIYTESDEIYVISYQCIRVPVPGTASAANWKCNCDGVQCASGSNQWTLQKFDMSFLR